VANALSQRPRIFSVIPLKKNLRENILTLQFDNDWYKDVKNNIRQDTMMVSNYEGYSLDNNILLRFYEKIYIPPNNELKILTLSEAHQVVYMAHLGVTKMKVDIKPLFFYKGLKADIVSYMVRCLECLQVKAKHIHPTRFLHPHVILE
jgi:hypothetical protein